MPKIIFSGYIDIDEIPDDAGTVDNWLAKAIDAAAERGRLSESGLDALNILHVTSDVDE